MTGRRELYLEEMGLGPVWHLRGAPVAAPGLADMVDVSAMDSAELKAAVASCTACELHKTRTQTVFGAVAESADWLFIGEAPGADEDAQGEPFVGQAGKLLDNMLESIGLERGKSVSILNVLKCRPPGNRDPLPGEVAKCVPYLKRQIELLKPKLIVSLGRFATQTLLDQQITIASARGNVHTYQGIPLVVTYHPAYLLRTPQDKARAWEDLCLAKQTMQDLCSGNSAAL